MNKEEIEKAKERLCFLKDMCKYYEVHHIEFTYESLDIYGYENKVINCPDYPENLKFENVEKFGSYTLKELGLE